MLAQRWKRVGQLFDDILELPEAEWSRRLDRECASARELRGEVKRLLGQHVLAEKSGFLKTPGDATHEVHRQKLLAGQTIGHYCIECELGRGGMGIVYKARDTQLDRIVAIKILVEDRSAHDDQKHKLIREAKSASALNHPNIVSVYEIGHQDGVHFIAMEYVTGQTLRERIPRFGMRPEQAVEYAIQIADALAAAHQCGIIHRDLKPENVMVSETGIAKLLDFGLAKGASPRYPPGSGESTVRGVILGTVNYMSPEQAEGQTVDSRSDIFSFGAVLYEMITGRRAFTGNSPAATLGAVIHHDPVSAQAARSMPAELRQMTKGCLEKDPSKRFQQMIEVRDSLVKLKGKARFSAPASSRWTPWIMLAAAILLSLFLARFGPSLNVPAKFKEPVTASAADRATARDLALRDFRAGFSAFGHWTPTEMNAAVSMFLSVVQLFPEGWYGYFGVAKARLAETLLSGGSFDSKREAILSYAERSVELGPEIAVTHATLAAALLLLEWKWVDAEREIELGIRWNPQNGEPYERRGQLRVLQGRFEEANRDFARALELRPNFDDCRLARAWGDFCAGNFELAIARINDLIASTKKKEQAYRLLAAAYGAKGEFREAEAALAKAWLPQLDRLNLEAWLAARQGDRPRAEATLEKIKALCEREALKYCDTALPETALGRYERALDSLEQGLRLRHWKLLFQSVDPRLKALHGDPRWTAIVARLRS